MPEEGLNILDQLEREREERERANRTPILPEDRAEEAQGDALDPPFPYEAIPMDF